MKKLYFRIDKNERKKAKKEFFETSFGKKQNVIFKRLLIYCIILFIFGILLLLEAIFIDKNIFSYLSSIIIIFFSIIFFICRYKVMVRNINNYLIEKRKKKK